LHLPNLDLTVAGLVDRHESLDFSFAPAFSRLYERVEQGAAGSTRPETFFSSSLSQAEAFKGTT